MIKESYILKKKKITIGKLVEIYKICIYFSIFLSINYVINLYFKYELEKCFDLEYCLNNKNDPLYVYFSNKINLYNSFIKYEFLVIFLLMIYRLKINFYYEYLEQFNIVIYFLSSLFYNIFLSESGLNIDRLNEGYKDSYIVKFIFLYYLENDTLSLFMVIFPVLFLCLFVFLKITEWISKYILTNIYNYYKTNIENMNIEYTESKFIQIDKIV